MPKKIATYDYAALGKMARHALALDGRGYRAVGDEIGVAPNVFTKLAAGQPVAAHSVIAVCDWLQCDPKGFYELNCFTDSHVKPTKNLPPAKARRARTMADILARQKREHETHERYQK